MTGRDLRTSELTAKHADWAESLVSGHTITVKNALEVVKKAGLVYTQILEHAGVHKRTAGEQEASLRFLRRAS